MSVEPIKMWTGKSIASFGCPKAFDFVYNKQLQPKARGFHLERGKAVHAVMAEAFRIVQRQDANAANAFPLALASVMKKMNIEPEGEMAKLVIPMSENLWKKIKDSKILEIEKVSTFEDRAAGFIWYIKPDSVAEDPDSSQWLLEYKSTKTFSNNVRKRYHREMQPWIYLFGLQATSYPNIRGVRILVTTDKDEYNPRKPLQKVEPCVVEELLLTPQKLEYAREYILDAVSQTFELQESIAKGEKIRKDRTKCVGMLSECPYIPLCEPGVENYEAYYNDLVNSMYQKVDPMQHLFEDQEVTNG